MNAKRMRGVYVVEFAIIGSLLFVLLFGVLEMGRLYFTVNGLDEVVRRGARLAAVCDIHDERILRRAIFNDINNAGASSLIGYLETADLDLVYLNENGAVVGSPNDLSSATGFRAIRYVQLRIDGFPFELLIPGFRGVFTLPAFRSTIPRESLGRHAEEGVVPEITPC
ncbi:MAG TPA: TadE/TadG family type IV pilus assembly protein [Pseudomonas sp.]